MMAMGYGDHLGSDGIQTDYNVALHLSWGVFGKQIIMKIFANKITAKKEYKLMKLYEITPIPERRI